MKRELTITDQPIDEPRLLSGRKMSEGMGAVVYFLGVVRGTEGDVVITAIEYESFQRMAEHQFQMLFDEMEKRWPLESVSCGAPGLRPRLAHSDPHLVGGRIQHSLLT